MAPASSEVITQQVTALRRFVVSGAEATSRIAIRPVFVDDAGRRRRLITGFGYLAALACIGYIVIVGISLTAGPTGPLAATPDPKPPNLVEDLVQPKAVPAAPASQATTVARPTPQPRAARRAPVVRTHAIPVTPPSAAPVTPSVIPTTKAIPTSKACGHRRGCASTTIAPAPEPVTGAVSTAAVPEPSRAR